MKPCSWKEVEEAFDAILEHLTEAQERLTMLDDDQVDIAVRRIGKAENVLLNLYQKLRRSFRERA